MFSTDTWLRIVVSMQINAILFGAGAIAVLTVPALSEHAKYLIPVVVFSSFALSPFLAGMIFPRMRIRTWGRRNWVKGDVISG